MKIWYSLLALFALWMSTLGAGAQTTLGTVVSNLPYTPSKVLADPVRDQVYVADTPSNSLVVLNTISLQVVATILIGSNPVDMAISRDGSTLYVANGGSTTTAIAVLDLNTNTIRARFALPATPMSIAVGLDDRIYVGASGNFQGGIYQLDGTTGTVQTVFNPGYYGNNLLQISPDGMKLFAASLGSDPGTLQSFDVSTSNPVALQTNEEASENAYQLVISHDGKSLCLPCGGGNAVGGPYYTTYLFSPSDINSHFGLFDNGDYPGPLAFSPDDSLVYQMAGNSGGGNTLQIFDVQTFSKVSQFIFPAIGADGYGDTVNSLVIDRTGSYLFVAETGTYVTEGGAFYYDGRLAILGTGKGTLKPPIPTLNLALSVTEDPIEGGHEGVITITRTGDLSNELTVTYRLKGTAQNGKDYNLLKGTKVMKAGKSAAKIRIIPIPQPAGTQPRTVKLIMQSAPAYLVGIHRKITAELVVGE